MAMMLNNAKSSLLRALLSSNKVLTSLDYKQRHVLRHLYFTSGCHYWEVMVERMDDPRGVVVGVASSEAFETGASEDAVGYVAAGFIVNSGVEIGRVQAFDVGDTVGVYLDMNAREVAFFRNDEAQHGLREAEGEETVNDETKVSRVVAAGDEARELRTNRTFVNTRRIPWHSFRSRTAFAAITISSEADSLIVVGSERPKGYR